MTNYKCKVCGYIYYPENGEDRNNTYPGTQFEELPKEWYCPHCGAGKNHFMAIA